VSEYKYEVDSCMKCGAPVDVLVEEKYLAQGMLYGRLIHRFKCRRGCLGNVLPPDFY
jgi:hypothetical protein